MEEKPRKDMLGFLVKELNSLNAVIGTLKDEIMARRMREESTRKSLVPVRR